MMSKVDIFRTLLFHVVISDIQLRRVLSLIQLLMLNYNYQLLFVLGTS